MNRRLPFLKLFAYRDFLLFLAYRLLRSPAMYAQSVVLGWQVYDLARQTYDVKQSAFMVGMIGLAIFLPMLILMPIAGDTVDRYSRKRIIVMCNLVDGVNALLLLWASMHGSLTLVWLFASAVATGSTRSFVQPAGSAIISALVPRTMLHRAVAWNVLSGQVGRVLGPLLGGVLVAVSLPFAYGTIAILYGGALLTSMVVQPGTRAAKKHPRRLQNIMEGFRYVGRNQLLFGAVTLNMMAVIFGGVTALLPVYARDILHVDAEGFGLLRAATAMGGGCTMVMLGFRPIQRHAGPWLMGSVVAYGVGTIIFSLSMSMAVSMVALIALGAANSVSTFVRQSLVQITTPDSMRGRVASVTGLFFNASTEVGDLESGVAARFLGPVGAALSGGIGALVVVALWCVLFPALRKADRLAEDEAES